MAVALGAALAASAAWAAPRFKDHYAQNGPVKIHYVSAGAASKPLVVMVHGYPDIWYTWRHLMDELDEDYRVVALDTRGYNLSDKPEGVDAYKHAVLMTDVEAVIRAEGRRSAILIGHDFGASTSWRTAMDRPELVDRLVILSVPHPTNMAFELKTNPVQQKNSQYARNNQQPGSEDKLTAEGLARWVRDPAAQKVYVEAFKRSNFKSMMNYYRANYSPTIGDAVVIPDNPPVKAPLLVLHGMKDTALGAAGHNNTWLRAEKDTTILMIPEAGHFLQHDAAPLVNRTIHDWLNARPVKAADQKAR
jgi:pimeloyl-ACP methyl ester carboxylesterase